MITVCLSLELLLMVCFYFNLYLDLIIHIHFTQNSHGIFTIGLAAQILHNWHSRKWSTLIKLSLSLHMSLTVDSYEYAKPFYCSAFGSNMKSGQIYWNILYTGMNVQEISIHLNILNTTKNCQRICNYIFTTVCHVGMVFTPQSFILSGF
jgi:hypothetical protein